jgi:18S rRNA (adenine1779-N6/adenine1780-N6)-dimethyltransferase
MPRATSEKFSRLHSSAPKPQNKVSGQTNIQLSSASGPRSKHTNAQGGGKDSGGGGTSNPLFNTERFGQHILKNPLVAQAFVFL